MSAPAYYTVFRDTDVVVAAVADSPEFPRAQPLDFGFHEAAHATAFGKVMLASLPAKQRREYLTSAGMPRLTAHTTVRSPDLETELQAVAHFAEFTVTFADAREITIGSLESPAR